MPRLYKKITTKYGARYQIGVTLMVTVATTIAATTVVGSTTVFNIIEFSATGLAVTIGWAVLISILRWHTSAMGVLWV
jgi:hypothetical protein